MKKPSAQNQSESLSYQEDGSPYCQRFDDIYFDTKSGTEQSDYVFVQQNQITSRLLTHSAKLETLTIAETGFGTGLNFLLTLVAYQQAQEKHGSALKNLHFISVEKYPLSKSQLSKSLACLPALKPVADELIKQYPEDEIKQGSEIFECHFFDKKIKLTVIFDDAARGFSTLKTLKSGNVDAWYLDGFSPAKNPDMWSKELFIQIARLSKEQATLTTFTVAGMVKRQLRDIGFRLEKLPAPGKKAEMFFAVMQSNPTTRYGYQLRPRITKPQHVSIIGGGIASACVAYALTKRGIKVTLYCKDTNLAQGGSSNAIGALYPLLHQQTDDISHFYQQAFWRAKSLYEEVSAAGFSFSHQWCGLLESSYKEVLLTRQQAFEQFNAWPKELIHGVNAEQASELANLPLAHGGLFMPNAGWISPPELTQALFNAAKATNRLKIMTDTHISKIKQIAKDSSLEAANTQQGKESFTWRLHSNQGEFNASVLVVCAGADSLEIEQLKALPLSATRGQVSNMKTSPNITKLSTVICHKGYLTPHKDGIHCIGATFQKNDLSLTPREEDNEYNLTTLSKCLPELSETIGWQTSDIASSKARLRCMSRDHLPLVGAVPNIAEHIKAYPHLAKDKNWRYSTPAPCIDSLYVVTGLGARGLCSAPLAADILAADLCNTPYPMNNHHLFNLSPNRFIIRDIIKRKISCEQ